MDQLKNFLGQVKKYHFWILCAIVVMVGLTSWYLATAALDKQTADGATKIKAAEGNVKSVAGIRPHPNAEFEKGMTTIVQNQARSVGRGWQFRYRQQEKLLVWPPMLGRDFHRVVEPLRPIEEHVGFSETEGYEKEKIPVEFLERYRNFIIDELPLIAEQIGAKWTAKPGEGSSRSTGGAGMGMGKSAPKGNSPYAKGPGAAGFRGATGKSNSEEEQEEDNSIVYWSEENQQEILSNHFPFTSEEQTPHTLDVLYAQEDLWVLTAIVQTIKRTNGDAEANYEAAIKMIQSIEMGRSVKGRMGKITEMQKASTGAPGAMGAGGMPGATAGGAPPAGAMPTTGPAGGATTGPAGPGMPGEAGSASAIVDPATNRYVDQDYNPLPPKTLRDAKNDPKMAIYSVAKRMPVRMRLVMDQRKLNTLLAECGNSSLPIEVRQVRINCEAGLLSEGAAGSSGGFSAGGAGAMGGKSMGSTSSGSGGSKFGGSKSGKGSMGGPGAMGMTSRGGSTEAEEDPNEIEVEVYGIVYIYNPENKKQLDNVDWTDDVAAPTAATPVVAPPRG